MDTLKKLSTAALLVAAVSFSGCGSSGTTVTEAEDTEPTTAPTTAPTAEPTCTYTFSTGDTSAVVIKDANFTMPTATATLGEEEANATTASADINTSAVGTYTLVYTASICDVNGTYTVTVQEEAKEEPTSGDVNISTVLPTF